MERILVTLPNGVQKHVGNYDAITKRYYRFGPDILNKTTSYAIGCDIATDLWLRGCEEVVLGSVGLKTKLANLIEHGERRQFTDFEPQFFLPAEYWQPLGG